MLLENININTMSMDANPIETVESFNASALTLPNSFFANNCADIPTRAGVNEPIGSEIRVDKDIKAAKFPYSESVKLRVIKRLKRKLKILATREPEKIITLPAISG